MNFTDDLYIKGYFRSIREIEDEIDKNKNRINSYKQTLIAIMFGTPKDIFPSSEDIIFDIQTIFDETMDSIIELEFSNYRLFKFLDYLNLNKIDLVEFNKENY